MGKHWFDISKRRYRERCVRAKGNRCFFCNRGRVEAHHINGNRSDGHIDNLLPLCKRCHGKVHQRENDQYQYLTERIGGESVDSGERLRVAPDPENEDDTIYIERDGEIFEEFKRLSLLCRSFTGDELDGQDFLDYVTENGLKSIRSASDYAVLSDIVDLPKFEAVEESSQTEDQQYDPDETSSELRSDPGGRKSSYVLRRAMNNGSASFERQNSVNFFIGDSLEQSEYETHARMDVSLKRSLMMADFREAAYKVALDNEELVYQELVNMGYVKSD